MKKTDRFEKEILESYARGEFVPTNEDKTPFKAAAQATACKDRRVNIRLSSPDLHDLQARALEEGIPYQTLIASVLHKYVSGRFIEKPSQPTVRSSSNDVIV